MIPYVLNGRPTAFWRGDWYVGKGIAHARIRARFPSPLTTTARSPTAATNHQGNNRPPGENQHSSNSNSKDGDATIIAAAAAAAADNHDFGLPHEESLTIEVFNTHTHAPYSGDKSDSYRVHRESQAWTLAKLLRSASEKKGNHLVIAAGDFNMTPLSTAHRIITSHAPVRDVWRVLHPDSSLGAWSEEKDAEAAAAAASTNDNGDEDDMAPTAEFNLVENGVTSNSVLNTWRWSKSKQSKLGKGDPSLTTIDPVLTLDPRGKRLDYIFANTAAHEVGKDGDSIGGWVVKHAHVTMTTRHPELQCSLSDHFAVAATLVYHQTSTTTPSQEGSGPGDGNLRGIDTTSLAGQHWPLPPGRGSLFHHHHNRRKSTPALLLQGSDDDKNLQNINNSQQEEDDSTAALETKGHDVRDPVGGAFLSLQSPTPSTSRLSLPGNLPAFAADYDIQLLSSLSASPSGDVAGFDIHDYDALLAGVREYVAREADQTRWRTYHFVFWLCITIICYVIVWFVPNHTNKLTSEQTHAINFVLLLLSSIGLVAGVLDGLMALLFFRGSEKRALKEFQWELSNARAFAFGETSGYIEKAGAAKH